VGVNGRPEMTGGSVDLNGDGDPGMNGGAISVLLLGPPRLPPPFPLHTIHLVHDACFSRHACIHAHQPCASSGTCTHTHTHTHTRTHRTHAHTRAHTHTHVERNVLCTSCCPRKRLPGAHTCAPMPLHRSWIPVSTGRRWW